MAVFNTFPVLETERLILRQLRPSDRAAVFRIYSDATIAYFNPYEQCRTIRDAEHIIAEIRSLFHERRGVYWGIAHRASGTIIGTCGFLNWYRAGLDARRAEIGFTLTSVYWRQGYSREACRRIINYGVETMGLNRIEANLMPDNSAAHALLENLGFVPEGLLRQRLYWDGCFHDVRHYALLRHDWPPPPQDRS